MSNAQLDAFLAGGEPAPETPQEAPAETPAPTPPPAEPTAPTPPEKAADDHDDADPPAPLEGETAVPRRAFEDERRKRQDWKEQAIRAQVERDELRKQVEDAKRAQPPPQPQQPQQPMDPAQQQEAVRDTKWRLNTSEMLMRRELGDEAVTILQDEFLEAAKADPSLYPRLYQQLDPYRWAKQQMEAIRLRNEIGENPQAYRERIRAELEAEIRGNGSDAAKPRTSPAAGMAPSLASARSAAPRSAPAWTGEPTLEEILAQRGRR